MVFKQHRNIKTACFHRNYQVTLGNRKMLPTNDGRRRPQCRGRLNYHSNFVFLTSTALKTIVLTVNNMFVVGMVIVMHVSPNDTMLWNNCALALMTLTELTDITLLKDAELFRTASQPNAPRVRSGKLAEASGRRGCEATGIAF